MWKLISGMSLTFGILPMALADEAPQKSDVTVEFCGRLRHGVVAIGGESTGTNISFNRIVWEVQLHNEADRTFAKQHHKKTVVVTGRLRKTRGIETGDRWIIDVSKMSEQDVTKNKEGVRLVILGVLRPAVPRNPGATLMTIHSGDQVWPVNFSANASLATAAESLIGQSILLAGSLKQATDDQRNAAPIIYVTNLKRRPIESILDEIE